MIPTPSDASITDALAKSISTTGWSTSRVERILQFVLAHKEVIHSEQKQQAVTLSVQEYTMENMQAKKVSVIQGDITNVPSDALIKSISHCGWATSNLDINIKQKFGNHFHAQVEEAISLTEGKTVVAQGAGNTDDTFANIVFVVDDATMRLSMIVCNALSAANKQGYKHVTLPALRTGILFSKRREQTLQEALAEIADELAEGVKAFFCQKSCIESVTFVIKHDPSFEALLVEALERKAHESKAELMVWRGESA